METHFMELIGSWKVNKNYEPTNMTSQVGLAQEDGKYHYEFIYSAIA